MCCVTFIKPLPPREMVEAVMAVSGFRAVQSIATGLWMRDFDPLPEDPQQRSRHISVAYETYSNPDDSRLAFRIVPHIGAHTIEDHRTAATLASIVFQMANHLAEQITGVVSQQALAGDCRLLEGGARRLADYSEGLPMRQDALCYGFREVLGQGIVLL